jgi:hypothetical protein
VKNLLIIPLVFAVAACSTANDVAINSAYQRSAAQTEAARMQAIAEIARQGESGVVAAALLMQQENGSTRRAPVSTGDRAAGLIAALAPVIVGVGQIGATVYAADANRDVSLAQSNNSRDVAINQSGNDATVMMHTNDTMSDIAAATIVNANVICVTDVTYTCE